MSISELANRTLKGTSKFGATDLVSKKYEINYQKMTTLKKNYIGTLKHLIFEEIMTKNYMLKEIPELCKAKAFANQRLVGCKSSKVSQFQKQWIQMGEDIVQFGKRTWRFYSSFIDKGQVISFNNPKGTLYIESTSILNISL